MKYQDYVLCRRHRMNMQQRIDHLEKEKAAIAKSETIPTQDGLRLIQDIGSAIEALQLAVDRYSAVLARHLAERHGEGHNVRTDA